jgi:predicted site-specific integrase-resolvase
MKKIKRKDIDPGRLITKSQLAKDRGVSPTTIQNMVNKGELSVVQIRGGEIIHL